MEANLGKLDTLFKCIYGYEGSVVGKGTFRILNMSYGHYLTVRYKNISEDQSTSDLVVWKPHGDDVAHMVSINVKGDLLSANMDHDKIVVVSQRREEIAATIYDHAGNFVREAIV